MKREVCISQYEEMKKWDRCGKKLVVGELGEEYIDIQCTPFF